jgi:hypothetical protein
MRQVLTWAMVASCIGCLGEGITGSSTVTGTYTLRTMNGSPLPYTIPGSGTDKTEIMSDAITLFQGGTYARERHSRVTVSGQVTNETVMEGGTYNLFGNSISMRLSGTGPIVQAVINGNTMTFVEDGVTSVFSK